MVRPWLETLADRSGQRDCGSRSQCPLRRPNADTPTRFRLLNIVLSRISRFSRTFQENNLAPLRWYPVDKKVNYQTYGQKNWSNGNNKNEQNKLKYETPFRSVRYRGRGGWQDLRAISIKNWRNVGDRASSFIRRRGEDSQRSLPISPALARVEFHFFFFLRRDKNNPFFRQYYPSIIVTRITF